MPKKKSSEKRISDYPDRVKLFETTSRYVKAEAEARGESRAAIIRVLCEEARRARMNESRARYELSSAVRDAQQKIVNRAFEAVAEKFALCAGQLTNVEAEIEALKHRIAALDEAHHAGRREQMLALSNVFWLAQKIWAEVFASIALLKFFVGNTDETGDGEAHDDAFAAFRERERRVGMQTLQEWHKERKMSADKEAED